MKRLFFLSFLLALAALLPSFFARHEVALAAVAPPQQSAAARQSALPAVSMIGLDASMRICALVEGAPVYMSLEDFILGAMAAEVPAEFEPEALKAQAVAIRTFVLNRMNSAPFEEHLGAVVCDDPGHCMAYIPFERMLSAWGSNADAYAIKFRQAVSDTGGMVLLYDNEPIQAVFFSCTGVYTEDSGDVWECDLDYLKSVESPLTEDAPDYLGRVEIDPDQFKESFLKTYPKAKFSGGVENWFSDYALSRAGAVISLSVGGVKVSGSQLRAMCSLNSANFTVCEENGRLVFYTVGRGHGVGMSQYGANELAKQGYTCEQILKTYYTGVAIAKYNPDELGAS